MKTLIFLVLILFAACSPQKRLERLVRKNPELIKVDTLTVHDTILGWNHDTTFIMQPKDTVLIEKENIKVTIIRDIDTFYVEMTADTVFREIKVPYEKIVVVPRNKIPLYWWIFLGIIGILVLYIFLRK